MTPDDLQRTYEGMKYKSPATDAEIMSVVPLLIELWKEAIYLSEFSHNPHYKVNFSDLKEAFKKLEETK